MSGSISRNPSRLRPALIVAAVLSLVACATATPYQPIGAGGASGGFSEQRIEANRYRVTFAGNSLTSRERVENYLLFRAAELPIALRVHDADREIEPFLDEIDATIGEHDLHADVGESSEVVRHHG